MRSGASPAAFALALCAVFAVATVPYGVGGQGGAAGPLVPDCGGGGKEPCPVTELNKLVANVFNWLVIIAGAAAVLAVVVAGIHYIVAALGGDSGAIQAAKQNLMYAIVGVLVLLLSYVIVRTILVILGVSLQDVGFYQTGN